MASTLEPAPVDQNAGPQHLLLHDVSWTLYEMLLREVDDSRLRTTYVGGTLEIMTKSHEHESWKKTIGNLIELICLEADIAVYGAGEFTMKVVEQHTGGEPDQSYDLG